MALQLSATISGSTVTVSVHNTGPSPRTTRVRVVVHLQTGGDETLESGSVTVQPNETIEVPLQASGPVEYIMDGPDPF